KWIYLSQLPLKGDQGLRVLAQASRILPSTDEKPKMRRRPPPDQRRRIRHSPALPASGFTRAQPIRRRWRGSGRLSTGIGFESLTPPLVADSQITLRFVSGFRINQS